jgi:predicted ribosome quality control (RQC) complex YloA/Tae2 family protein
MNFKKDTIEIEDKLYDIYIGKNAKGNEEIIKISHPESLWFHINNISSAHVILESKGDDIHKRFLIQIAKILLETKNNCPNNVNVVYTQVKNVKLTKQLGTVIPSKTKIIKF